MKNKTLPILLLLPFVVSLVTFASIEILENNVASDISGIEWDYEENEGFLVSDTKEYELKATPIAQDNVILAKGNNLVWKTRKLNETDPESLVIRKSGSKYFLQAVAEGQMEIVCSNERGTVSRSFIGVGFENGAMVINPLRKGSGASITGTPTYGLYDLEYRSLEIDAYSKVKSTFEVRSTAFTPDGTSFVNVLADCSPNVTYDKGVVTLLAPGDSYITLREPSLNVYSTYRFQVVDGVNVYRYDDLLMATNFSSQGENVVLRASLNSLRDLYTPIKEGDKILGYSNVYLPGKEGGEMFGHYDFASQSFSFLQEVYSFETTYDTSFIDFYNSREERKANPSQMVSKTLVAGIRLQGDLYGNGYSINMDSLCFPHYGTYSKEGKGKRIPTKGKDLFLGPLPLYAIGQPGLQSLVSSLGQDNAGILVDKDGVTISDVYLSNTNNLSNFYDLSYSGTVVEVNADNVTITSSVLSNGKVACRAFSADNLRISNSILKNSGEFNLMLGSNRTNPFHPNQKVEAHYYDGASQTSLAGDFVKGEGPNDANARLNAFLGQSVAGNANKKDENGDLVYDYIHDVKEIQKALDNTEGIQDGQEIVYDSHVTLENVLFGHSGVFSIALESFFNGPILQGDCPSSLTSYLSTFGDIPKNMGRTSYPVELTFRGNNRFYDWKPVDSIDASSLIEENISSLLSAIGYGGKNFTVDGIFPMKLALKQAAKKSSLLHEEGGNSYLNTAVAHYGGGVNLSSVQGLTPSEENSFSEELEVDLLRYLVETSPGGNSLLLKEAVPLVIGSHPFRFIVNGKEEAGNPHIDVSSGPKIETLKQTAQGGKA
ncbi:MAG: hypothetical protein SPI58_02950 [Candidatus Enteromonas sp.]|nr:hypothetical protein [Candidatus Enteromonas sp.]